MKKVLISTWLILLFYSSVFAQGKGEFKIYPNEKKQEVWGIGFEIQSDAIGSGNTGLPEDSIVSVPYGLTVKERERFAKEMLKGFRFCRVAGGLYWRGTDQEQKQLQPRWSTQLEEIKEMMDLAGVEGVSLEYWSPTPYWKANSSYLGTSDKDIYNTLRCFGPDFKDDPIYKGDTTRFLQEFAEACVNDIKTLQQAGIKTVQWGLQNEPWVSNNQRYSSCRYGKAEDYVTAYTATASKVRAYDPSILLLSDTETAFPRKIAVGMHRPEVADLVDAYAVHTIGWDSESVKKVGKKIEEELPKRPWFQNEYEYLSGEATPERCLNNVQHIMNSFQLVGNPTWYWIHALKPFKNSEASGYSLGFWKALNSEKKEMNEAYQRWQGGPEIQEMSAEFKAMEFVNVTRKSAKKPGRDFNFILGQETMVYLVVDQHGDYVPEDKWIKTNKVIKREGGTDVVYTCILKKGKHQIPSHTGQKDETYGAPHALFLDKTGHKNFALEVGVNSPMKIRSNAMKLEKAAATMKPGHWIYNDYNWNAVGSFIKHMPWNSTVLKVEESEYNKDARILVFERPNGKRTIVISNRTGGDYDFTIDTQCSSKSKWKVYRYTPYDRGENSMGVKMGIFKGKEIKATLPHLSWEFWEEK
ncbi:hypothetical protein [Flammeovirga aprica]|uniref:Uncharacterized protein n=1 Tax=Flammeovirga aprica JL-4 TaxID=694437 RepID=A0A7X9RUW9_9BACT|nr:hypothetical protein [Flammeovirga aprica]NME69151.1 hypothetical protein [Flammeovirga aprica JL-4]